MPSLLTTNRRITRGARTMEAAIAAWLQRYGAHVLRTELSRRGWAAKQTPEDRLQEQLRDLLLGFGLRQAAEAAQAGAREAGGGLVIPGRFVTDAIAGRAIPLRWLERYVGQTERRVEDVAMETRDRIARTVRAIIADADAETPRPSAGEIARRIRTTTLATDGAGVYVLSSERAAVIAQTESGIADSVGTYEGYRATGVDEIEWLARDDGKSGDRRHDKMDGVCVPLGEMFVLPDGARMRYPHDPLGPVRHLVNCRCGKAPVIRRRKKR
jgi:hypothetical protein